MSTSDLYDFKFPSVPHAYLIPLENLRGGKGYMGIDLAVSVLQRLSQVTPEEAHPRAKKLHDNAVAAGLEPYNWAEHLLKWPKVSADRVKMQIVKSGGENTAAFYISYDS